MMLEALRKRYYARRNKDLVSLLKFLQNPYMIQSEDDFKYSSKAAIINCAKNVIRQIFSSEIHKMEHDETFEDVVIEENPSLAAQM
jgi:hypothetical protein